MKHKFMVFNLLLCIAGGLTALSCVNQDYDLNEMDETVNFGGEAFVLPLGSTDTLLLKDLLSEEDLDFLKEAEDGTYLVEVAEAMDLTDLMPDLSDAIHFEDVAAQEKITYSLLESLAGANPAPVQLEDNGQAAEFHLNIGPIDIPQEIEHLDYIYMEDAYFYLDVAFEDIPGFEADFRLELDIELPKELLSDDPRLNENRHIFIDQYFEDHQLSLDPLHITGFDFSDIELTSPFEHDELIRVTGRLYAEHPELDLTEYVGTPIELTINLGVRHMVVTRVFGTLDYEMTYDQTFSLGDLPDFMQNEDFVLDLYNPHLCLDMISNLGVPMNATVDIFPIWNGVPDQNSKASVDLSIPSSEHPEDLLTTRYWIADSNADMPEGYVFIQEDLSVLLQRIPDSFLMQINGRTDKSVEHVFEPQADYYVEIDYDFVVPLAFGPNLSMALSDTLTNMPPVLGKLLDMGSLSFIGDVVNSLPLQLEMELELLDADYQLIPLQTPCKQLIHACGLDGNPSLTTLNLNVQAQEGADASALEHIRLNFYLTSGDLEGLALDVEDFIRATLAVGVPGGLTGTFDEWGELFDKE